MCSRVAAGVPEARVVLIQGHLPMQRLLVSTKREKSVETDQPVVPAGQAVQDSV